ncbi:MAG: type II toxin-antitoxin system VapC family toxin [Caulobacteraceae bacterium]|nr:type II toxin-antitoxin system VapC family toxin [Caulobacteraceae bacterium]
MVVDASAIIEALLQSPRGKTVERFLLDPELTFHAPHLLDMEVAHALRRHAVTGLIDPVRGRQAIDDLGALPIVRYPHDMLISRVWELRNNLTAYDAVYVALAEVLNVPLLTGDRRLASSPGHSVVVEVI